MTIFILNTRDSREKYLPIKFYVNVSGKNVFRKIIFLCFRNTMITLKYLKGGGTIKQILD